MRWCFLPRCRVTPIMKAMWLEVDLAVADYGNRALAGDTLVWKLCHGDVTVENGRMIIPEGRGCLMWDALMCRWPQDQGAAHGFKAGACRVRT